MYCNHYGFSEKPFDVTPDPRFLYMTEEHRETLASLIYGIKERRGFITIIGEVGTGKTTLLNAALDRLDANIKTAFIFNTYVTFEQLMNMILHELGLAKFSEQVSKPDAIHRLNRFAVQQLARGGTVALIIDEAQNLRQEALENLRMLSNLETRKYKLVQIVLSGQPELDIKLARPELRQLTQRINLKRYVTPLKENDTYAYIRHRLKRANYTGSSLFTRKAQQLIWEYTGGIPRKINMLCDNALLAAYGMKQKKINAETIQEAIEDLSWGGFNDIETSADTLPAAKIPPRRRSKSRRRSFAWAAALMLAIFLFFAGGFYLGRSDLYAPRDADLNGAVKSHAVLPVQSPGVRGSMKSNKPDLPKQQVVVQKNEVTTQPHMDNKPEGYAVQQATADFPGDPAVDQKAKTIIEPSTDDKPLDHEIHPATDDFQDFPKTSPPGNEIAPETTSATNRSEKETAGNPSAQEQIIKSTGAIGLNGPAIVSTLPVETDIKNRQVKVQSDETFFRIIFKRCGTYDDVILARVLEENPDITDPSRIRAGQIITLPVSCVQGTD